MLELVLNELSFRRLDTVCGAAPDVYTARTWMSQFIINIRAARQVGFGSSIRTERGFSTLELAPSYSMLQWRNDRDVNRDERLFLSNLVAKSPHLEGALNEVLETAGRTEVRIAGLASSGLLAALLLDAIAVSWQSHNIWKPPLLRADFTQLSMQGELVEQVVEIRHASAPEHWQHHDSWIERGQRTALTNGEELWGRAARFFPYLEFCGTAEGQIRALTGNERYYDWIVRCLRMANLRCSTWVSGPFPHSLLPGPASGESTSVHQDPELRRRREFQMASGEVRMFEHHMKNNAENKRIHYFADERRRRVCIAYVGDHLPTARY